jgi:hypothetical protein
MTYSIDGSDFSNTTGYFDILPENIYTVIAKDIDGCISWACDTILSFGHAPNIGTVADFVLFTTAGAISNTGISLITGGAVGTNAGAMTGFDSVICIKHIQDSATDKCSIDLQAAFNEIHNIPITQIIPPENLPLAGTYNAGVYYINYAASITTALTLDAQNNPDALFIFNVTGAFTAATSAQMYLINEASPNNIFWNVDGAVEMAASASMKGTFLSLAGTINLGKGAILEGRALTIAGAVTIDENSFTECIRPVTPVLIITQPSNSVPTGKITITEPTGLGMTYKIDNCDFTNTTGEFDLLPPGKYTVTAKNSDGCISSSTIATIDPSFFIWTGSSSNDWNNRYNWSEWIIPNDTINVLIPDANTTLLDPILPIAGYVKTIMIQSGGIIEGGTSTNLNIFGSLSSWNNLGSFNPGTSNITFKNANATMLGTTDFYDITIASGAELTLESGNILRLSGTFNLEGTGVLNAASIPNTIEYNGDNQTVINPNGTITGYNNLILSGSGTKTMPVTPTLVTGDFTISGTTSATALESLNVDGNFTIGASAEFITGIFTHSIGGNFYNDGLFNTLGSTIIFNGTSAQNIGGLASTTFNNLTIDNSLGVTLINDNMTTILGDLTINDGKLFNIAAGKQLTVSGTIINNSGNSGFILQSDINGTASLINNTNSVPATVKRYISGAAEAWHFLSSPVSAQIISGSWIPAGTYGNGTGYDLYLWNEPNSCWLYKLDSTSIINWRIVHPETDFKIGRGYLYSLQATNPTKDFAGNLNNGIMNYELTYSSTHLTLKGFNLVGNPYPSSIDWSAASGWDRTYLAGSGGGYNMWIWNPAANNYGVYNSATEIGTNNITRNIAPMQGYFVQVSSNFEMSSTNDVRVTIGANDWFVLTPNRDTTLSLIVTSEAGNGFDEIQLEFGYTSNENGAVKLFSHKKSAPSIYMNSDNTNLSVRYLTNTKENPEVPVMFKPGTDGNFSIKCNFDLKKFKTVKLADHITNCIQNMKEDQTYKFKASKTDNANRFILYLDSINIPLYNELPANIYKDGNDLVIDLNLVSEGTDVIIYDLMGRIMFQQKLSGKNRHKLNFNACSQLLFIYLKNPDGNLYRKLLWVRE